METTITPPRALLVGNSKLGNNTIYYFSRYDSDIAKNEV